MIQIEQAMTEPKQARTKLAALAGDDLIMLENQMSEKERITLGRGITGLQVFS